MKGVKPARLLRVASRFGLVIAIAFVLGVVGMQFEGIVAKNIAVAHELSSSRADIAMLRERKARQLRTIRRLGTAAGAVPEIHERLRLVGPHEEIIYVRGAAVDAIDPNGAGDSR